MSRTCPRESLLLENKTLPSRLARRTREKVVKESSTEKEEEDDDGDGDESTKCDPDEMTLFIRRFSKMIRKKKFFKRDKKDKLRTRTKRACYICGKYGNYIVNCPHEG
jgi:hypothetical protein